MRWLLDYRLISAALTCAIVAMIAWGLSGGHVEKAKSIDPLASEWMERFRELAAARMGYQAALIDDGPEHWNRIFPPRIRMLHDYAGPNARLLKTAADWRQLENQIVVSAYTHDEIKEPIGETADAVIAEKDVMGINGSRYTVVLFSKGNVLAIQRKQVLVLDVSKDGSFRLAGRDVADKALIEALKANGVSNREVEIRGEQGTLFRDILHARALCERAGASRISIIEAKPKDSPQKVHHAGEPSE